VLHRILYALQVIVAVAVRRPVVKIVF